MNCFLVGISALLTCSSLQIVFGVHAFTPCTSPHNGHFTTCWALHLLPGPFSACRTRLISAAVATSGC